MVKTREPVYTEKNVSAYRKSSTMHNIHEGVALRKQHLHCKILLRKKYSKECNLIEAIACLEHDLQVPHC